MNTGLPIPTVKRFPSYLRILREAEEEGTRTISATTLAQNLDLNPIQVRKDLALTGIEGKPRSGFSIRELIDAIIHTLGWHNTTDALIVGAGNLGTAIARYAGFEAYGLKIVGMFDRDPAKIGTVIGGFLVKPIEELGPFIAENHVAIGVITVPGGCAQCVADTLVECGIRGIWNFAPKAITVPPEIVVQKTDLATHFAVLSVKLGKKIAEAEASEDTEDMIN